MHDKHDEGIRACNLKVGDVVKAHVQLQSTADRDILSKLSYKAKVPFVITVDLG